MEWGRDTNFVLNRLRFASYRKGIFMKRKLLILALCCFALALCFFLLAYFMFHYMTPDGAFTSTWHEEAGKPFVTMLVGVVGAFFLSDAIVISLSALLFGGMSDETE